MYSAHDLEHILGIELHTSSLDRIEHPILEKNHLIFYLKRDDKLHPIISGNKWRKLKYLISHALELNYDHLISMGGPYSNHLHALAFIGKQLNFKTTCLIIGEEKNKIKRRAVEKIKEQKKDKNENETEYTKRKDGKNT